MDRREFIAAVLACACVRGSTQRRVQQLLQGMPTTDGAGVRLTRVIGQPALRNLDPFIMLNRFHSDDPSAYIRGFPDHPHRGFETITVMLDGRMRHKDSKGNSGLIGPGGIQWMTTGRGIVHSEMPEQENGLMSGFQLWLNLPKREKMCAQHYQDLSASAIQSVPGGHARLIAGNVLGVRGAVEARATEPILLTAMLDDDAPLDVATPPDHAAFVFVHQGAALIGDTPVPSNTLAILSEGTSMRIRAQQSRTGVLVAAARPLREPIVQRGPFVMNTEEEIRQAWADYQNGTLVL